MSDEGIKSAAAAVHPTVEASEKDYEAMYQKHSAAAERAKSDYERHLREMVDKLSTSHLEPLAKVLLKCENRVLIGQDEVIRLFKENLLDRLMEAFHTSWESCNITNSLATLEILKEHFKEYEGQNLHMKDMAPAQRILPLRIRYKETSKRYLQKQIDLQNVKMKELMETNSSHRTRIQEIINQRVYLQKVMESVTKQLPQNVEKMQQLQEDLLKD